VWICQQLTLGPLASYGSARQNDTDGFLHGTVCCVSSNHCRGSSHFEVLAYRLNGQNQITEIMKMVGKSGDMHTHTRVQLLVRLRGLYKYNVEMNLGEIRYEDGNHTELAQDSV
jgi:hypothetical protein